MLRGLTVKGTFEQRLERRVPILWDRQGEREFLGRGTGQSRGLGIELCELTVLQVALYG